jgi:hypothetical protein
MYLNRITLISFLGGDAERKVSNATNTAVFSVAAKTSWKNDAGAWQSRTEWHRCVPFASQLSSPPLSPRGAHCREGRTAQPRIPARDRCRPLVDLNPSATLETPGRLRRQARPRRTPCIERRQPRGGAP